MGDQQIFLAGMENYKQSFCLADIDPNIEFITHFSAINPIYQHPSALMPLPLDNQYLPESSETFPAGSAIQQDTSPLIHIHHSQRKRKAMEISSSAHSSPQVSDNETRTQNSTVGRGKKVKRGEKKEAKSAEVVHVRAKRGQATDSHSLAERVRREKINERLRCLQDIVPGCYKTMGMAVMLDEIINYVQSLQNQVEFLSMKLTAASTFYDFNSEASALETMQKAKAFEASKIQNGISHGLSSAQFAALSCNFEYCPQFPHNK